MKKGYKLLAGLFATAIIFSACTRTDIEEEKLGKIDVFDNLVVDIKDDKEIYSYISKDGIEKGQLESNGIVKTYSEKNDVVIFLEYHNDGKRINIRTKDDLKYIKIDDFISLLKLSSDGKYMFLKEQKDEIISEYSIIDTQTLEKIVLDDEIFISGKIVDFLDEKQIVFYGVDSEKKISGLFTYNILTKKYELLREVDGRFVNYIKVLDSENIFLSAADDDEKYLGILNIKSGKINYVNADFKYIQDAVLEKDKVYFSGVENENMNLYMMDIKNKIVKRLTFDFPKNLGLDSYLINEEGKIYFSDVDGRLYFYDTEKNTTNILKKQDGIYMIVDK